MKTIWYGPTGWVTGDGTLKIQYPSAQHQSTVVTCMSPGDYKWIGMSLPLPFEVAIEEVVVCYQVQSPTSFISQVRLVEMTTPDVAQVRHDDSTHLKSTTPTSYSSVVAGFVPTGAVTVELRLTFQSAQQHISLGAIGLKLGPKSPGLPWLMSSETYAIGYDPSDWESLAESKVTFITHCPVNDGFFARCHALGIRCFPYTTFYQCNAEAQYQDVKIKEFHEMIAIDANGNYMRSPFWDSEDLKNSYAACPNVNAFRTAMLTWVNKLMTLGADGIFADNLSACPPCYGPKFGKHQHVYPTQNIDDATENQQMQTHAMAMLLKETRDLIRQQKREGAILGNSGYPPGLPQEFWSYIDADMLESFICTWASADRLYDWTTYWDQTDQALQPHLQSGKQIQALSYLGHTSYGIREDAFFCYATARLAGFVWNGGLPLSNPEAAVLYRIRLGRALTSELVSAEQVHYRVFERGLVAVNPDKQQARSVAIASPIPTSQFVDLFGTKVASSWNGYPVLGYSVDEVEKHAGSARSIVCTLQSAADASGASQGVVLDQTLATPLIASGWSKAENVTGGPDGNYAIYIDAVYSDGTNLLGQVAPFSGGTHDWEQQSVTITPAKPLKGLILYALFRNRTGKVWFDNFSLKEAGGVSELLTNGGFDDVTYQRSLVDARATNTLSVPAYSGRVYLFGSGLNDQLTKTSPKLTIVTSPPLGEVQFSVDGFTYFTHRGYWATEYVFGAEFGRFETVFDGPGNHTVTLLNNPAQDLTTTTGYGSSQLLGTDMDPANPIEHSNGKKYVFNQWTGLGNSLTVQLDVTGDVTLTAEFTVQ